MAVQVIGYLATDTDGIYKISQKYFNFITSTT
jgi:hypothetical protein